MQRKDWLFVSVRLSPFISGVSLLSKIYLLNSYSLNYSLTIVLAILLLWINSVRIRANILSIESQTIFDRIFVRGIRFQWHSGSSLVTPFFRETIFNFWQTVRQNISFFNNKIVLSFRMNDTFVSLYHKKEYI